MPCVQHLVQDVNWPIGTDSETRCGWQRLTIGSRERKMLQKRTERVKGDLCFQSLKLVSAL
jgi:hypothetical protein